MIRKLILAGALSPFILLAGEQAYWLAWHKYTYGTWLTHFRPLTRADVTCTPPATITIRLGEYTGPLPVAEIIDWCGFRDEYDKAITFSGSQSVIQDDSRK